MAADHHWHCGIHGIFKNHYCYVKHWGEDTGRHCWGRGGFGSSGIGRDDCSADAPIHPDCWPKAPEQASVA